MTETFTTEQHEEMEWWLTTNGYESIEAWGRDSDYLFTECCGWVDEFDNPVDLLVQLWHAYEADWSDWAEQRSE